MHYVLFSFNFVQATEIDLSKLKYNSRDSLIETQKKYLKLINSECKDYGLDSLSGGESKSVKSLLEKYPKELVYKYLKEHFNEICYYGVSLSVKYLFSEFKDNLSQIFVDKIFQCLRRTKNIYCEDINKEFFYLDSVSILGQVCSRESFKLFKQLNCKYKDLKLKSCESYNINSYKKCPDYNQIKLEVKNLYKIFFAQGCRKYKWYEPKCLKF